MELLNLFGCFDEFIVVVVKVNFNVVIVNQIGGFIVMLWCDEVLVIL